MPNPQQPPPSLEQALQELEQIIASMEAGELGLEETLAHYERGRFLIRHCQGVLNQAQQRLEQFPATTSETDDPLSPI